MINLSKTQQNGVLSLTCFMLALGPAIAQPRDLSGRNGARADAMLRLFVADQADASSGRNAGLRMQKTEPGIRDSLKCFDSSGRNRARSSEEFGLIKCTD